MIEHVQTHKTNEEDLLSVRVQAPTRLMLQRPVNINARNLHVCAARVDAKMSKTKLTRLPKVRQRLCFPMCLSTCSL